ncbi:Cullin binding-domain-containing protein [Peziza echinospora]|nr:Cullin binding-domain-containing protein [Peziza echinospora]
MSSLTSSQRAAVAQFTACTRCPEKTAAKFLKTHSWNVELAVDSYFSSNAGALAPTPTAGVSVTSINKVFDQYRDRTDPPDTIMVNGTMNYIQQLGLDLEEPAVLVLCEALKAPTMGEIARAGFVEGWRAMGCDTIEKMRAKIPDLRNIILTDEARFKRVYLFTFNFARAANQKSLPLDTAIEYWKLLLGKKWKSHIDLWIEFLQRDYKKSIAKDTWNMLYDFVPLCEQDPELKEYDEEGAWPSILDSFVEFVRKRSGQVVMDTT